MLSTKYHKYDSKDRNIRRKGSNLKPRTIIQGPWKPEVKNWHSDSVFQWKLSNSK